MEVRKTSCLSSVTSVLTKEVIWTLASVGFSDERQGQSIGSLSGGWKMKLALARAMLLKANADILLNELTNYLGVVTLLGWRTTLPTSSLALRSQFYCYIT